MPGQQATELAQALWVSLLGMGAVFAFLLLLLGVLSLQSRLLARFGGDGGGSSGLAGASEDDPEEGLRRRAAAAAAEQHHREVR